MNKKMRIAGLLLVLCLATSCFVGGTFAKYTSTATGSDTVKVAKWDITVENAQIAVTPNASVNFDLFNTIKDTNDQAETDVASGLIAPGTQGSFELNVVNSSEVTAKAIVTLVETNANNIPILYSLNGTEWKSFSELDVDANTNGIQVLNQNMNFGANDNTADVTIHWKWAFETQNGDASDTALGIYAQNSNTVPSVTVAATITVEQVD